MNNDPDLNFNTMQSQDFAFYKNNISDNYTVVIRHQYIGFMTTTVKKSVQSKHEAVFQVKYCNLSAFEKTE